MVPDFSETVRTYVKECAGDHVAWAHLTWTVLHDLEDLDDHDLTHVIKCLELHLERQGEALTVTTWRELIRAEAVRADRVWT